MTGPARRKKTCGKKAKQAKVAIARRLEKMGKERKKKQNTRQKRAQTQEILR